MAEDLQPDKLVEVANNSNAMDFSEEADDDPSLGLKPTQQGRKLHRVVKVT